MSDGANVLSVDEDWLRNVIRDELQNFVVYGDQIADSSIGSRHIDSMDASKLTGTIADARIPASIARDRRVTRHPP